MNKSFVFLGIIVGIIFFGVLYVVTSYNHLVTLNESIDGKWAQVESQYQRRLDLIPNLVNAVKGSLMQEQTVFGALADARTRYAGATTVDEKVAAVNAVENLLGRLMVIVENYPALASNQNVKELQVDLAGTENRIAVERMRFNEGVQAYNTSIKRFPMSMIAKNFGFDARAYFEAQSGAATAPTVDLSL